jgi:AraC-like DNA-binding protein
MMSGANPQQAFSDYREFPVPPQLASHFLCFWTQTISGLVSTYEHRVLPDGCVDIVLINSKAPEVVGPWTDPFVVGFAAGATICGARLRPGCAASIFGMPAVELWNRSVPLSALWGTARSAELASVAERPTLFEQRAALSAALITRLGTALPIDKATVASIEWLSHHHNVSVRRLSEWLGISSRQLHRRFLEAVGYGPKMFQSILRFQRLLYLSHTKCAAQSLAELATDAGYSDQAHMTREVRRFASCSPTALLPSAQCTLLMSDLFKTHDSLSDYR